MAVKKTKNKIEKISIVDQVFSSIKQDIVDGVWKVGERLPSESEFADIFGVNRLSVRMALQKLSAVGIIETKVGEGSFVKEFSMRSFIDEISVFFEDEESMQEIKALRNLVEVESTRLAVIYATDEEKAVLKELLDDFTEAKNKQTKDVDNEALREAVVDADLAFHTQIVKMSHNRLYLEIFYMVKKLVRQHIYNLITRRSLAIRDKNLEEPNESHRIVYEGIINGDTSISEKAYHEIIDVIPWGNVDQTDAGRN